jgi:hypothetical protein
MILALKRAWRKWRLSRHPQRTADIVEPHRVYFFNKDAIWYDEGDGKGMQKMQTTEDVKGRWCR